MTEQERIDRDFERAIKEWGEFKKDNNLRGVDAETCETCKHVEFGYEGERNCTHPERYNPELGDWLLPGVDPLTVCDKWEKK